MRKMRLPIDDGTRKYLDEAFGWIVKNFGLEELRERKTVTPTEVDIPVKYDKSERSLYELVDVVCKQIEIDSETVSLVVYKDGSHAFDNMPLGRQERRGAAGLYLGKNALGLTEIAFYAVQLVSMFSHSGDGA